MAQQRLKTLGICPIYPNYDMVLTHFSVSVPHSNGITPQLPNRLPPTMKNQIDSINEKYDSTWRTIEREAIRDGWSDDIIISTWDHFLLEAAKTYLPQGAQVVRLRAEEMWDRFLCKCSMRMKGLRLTTSVPGKAFPELQGKGDDEERKEKDILSPSPPRRSEKEPRSPSRSRTLARTQARYEHYREPYGPRERSRGGGVNGRREEAPEGRYWARRNRINRDRPRRSRSPRTRRPEGQYERYRT
jgi:hypothetical protein